MDTEMETYKIYATILNRRLEKEAEEKLKKGQYGFRKGRRTMDAVYIVNHVVNRELSKKRRKDVCLFRGKLHSIMWIGS